ncbi:MAG: IS1595 family transposase [bacterium]|nr:IS1595 family transposase [bacterium]
MINGKDMPKTLLQAARYFADPDRCHEYMVSIKWPDGQISCPKCGGDQIGEIRSRRMFQCKTKECRKQFSTKVGTIFEDSPIGLDKWFVAVWCIANAKNGISSCELSRAIGVTQKTSWFMLHRIRMAMRTASFAKISGEVESDELFFGGRETNKHASKKRRRGPGPVGKAVVHGLLERGGRVDAKHVPNSKRATLHGRIRKNVEPGSAVFTDIFPAYGGGGLDADFVHEMIDHSVSYVEGRVHTNGMENFWSLLRRSLAGTYVRASVAHLQAYLDEQVFRFNERKGTDASRFGQTMRQVLGKRLRCAELTAR